MDEPLQAYHKTLKLPCDGLQSGLTHKTILDAKVREAVMTAAGGTAGLKCELSDNPAAQLAATLKTDSCAVKLETQYGQNVSFVSGERRTFVSYGISAECRVAALEVAEASAERVRVILKITGALAGAAVFFELVNLALDSMHYVRVPIYFVVLSVVCGLWCGRKLGDVLGVVVENRAAKQALNAGIMTEADMLWNTLTEKLDLASKDYERV